MFTLQFFRDLNKGAIRVPQGFLICLTGVDGSGKSTHAKSLAKFLANKGYPCKYVWGASRPVFSYFFFAFTRVFGFWKKTKKDTYTDPLEDADRRVVKILGAVWRQFLFIDFQIRTFFRIRYPLLLGKIVVCDRYFYDMLMDLSVTGKSSVRFVTVISHTLPVPVIGFLLDAPDSVINDRRAFLSEELPIKRRAFLTIAGLFNLITIESSQDFSINQERIRTLTLAKIRASK